MRMNYTTPEIEINKFNAENIVTLSGEVETATLKKTMEDAGYTVTSVDINVIL